MAKGINKVILVGNLGNDPEIRYLSSGTAVCHFSLATGEKIKDKKTGSIKEKTQWHRIILFARDAEIAGQYLKKGSKAGIIGKLQTRQYTDDQGQRRMITEVVNSELTVLDSHQANRCQKSQAHSSLSHETQDPFMEDGE